jgi:hypothetical protein
VTTSDGTASSIERDFLLDHNRITLAGDAQVRLYFAQIRKVLGGLRGSVEQGTSISNAERGAVAHFVERLQHTFELLALRHFFSDGASELRIDSSDSGFAHFGMLLELAAELTRKDTELAGIPGFDELKRRMLKQIVDHGVDPRPLQIEMMRRLYLEALAPEKLFAAFVPGKLEKVGKVGQGDERASYFWSFATYDRALNRPFIYLIYFAYDADKQELTEESDAFAEIRSVAESSAGGRINLLGFSNRLDEKVVRMSPRIVKRFVLGPYWAPHVANAEGEFGELLASLEDRLPYALRWEVETLISERETRVGGGWLTKGQLRQVFWIPKELDLSQRGVSQFERFVLLPHWLAQHVEAANLLTDHARIALPSVEGAAS